MHLSHVHGLNDSCQTLSVNNLNITYDTQVQICFIDIIFSLVDWLSWWFVLFQTTFVAGYLIQLLYFNVYVSQNIFLFNIQCSFVSDLCLKSKCINEINTWGLIDKKDHQNIIFENIWLTTPSSTCNKHKKLHKLVNFLWSTLLFFVDWCIDSMKTLCGTLPPYVEWKKAEIL